MADDSGQDKTEDPTGKRLGDSRKKGQIARSKELNVFVTLVVSASMFVIYGRQMAEQLQHILSMELQISREEIFDPMTPIIHFRQVFSKGLAIIFPFALILLIADLVTPILMGGWNFAMEGFSFKISKLSPLAGIKRIFGVQGLMELLKAIVKTLLVGFVAWNLFQIYADDFMSLSSQHVEQAIYRMADIIVYCTLILSATFLLLVLIDVPYQLWHHQQQLKMTKQEVRDEAKDMEGNPEIKGKIRRLQMEAARRRMMEAVPTADVIVTNPTHFAVALKYEPNGDSAPIVVAKGVDLIATQIRGIGIAAKVTIVEAPPLSRALYYSTELDQEIPRGLFLAVAQVLAYVYQLRAAIQNGWIKPPPPKDIPVPEDFKQ